MREPSPALTLLETSNLSIRERATSVTAGIWWSSPGYRDADIDAIVGRVVPISNAAMRASAVATEAFLVASADAAGVETSAGMIDVSMETVRGVSAQEVYGRLGPTVWGGLSRGMTVDEAATMGAQRLAKVIETNIQLARTHTSRDVMKRQDGIVGYQRVPSGKNPCALCLLASTQRYHYDTLMPIHPGCQCTVEAIYGKQDPGQIIDGETLDQVNAQIAERFGTKYERKDLAAMHDLVVVRSHGELGPVLEFAGKAA